MTDIDLGSAGLGDLEKLELELERDIIESVGGYHDFLVEAWHTVEPSKLIDERYVRFLCDHMEALMRGKLPSNRLLINIPPGHTKSMTMVVLSLPYLWTLDPTAFVIYAHKDQALARDMARKTRQCITSEWYQARWPHIKLKDDASKIDRFSNTMGGGRVAVTVRQQITGAHAKGALGGLIVIDDPDRPDDTDLETENTGRWYREVLPTRFASLDESQICIVQQRISMRDLSAYVLDGEEDYVHVNLPMEFDPDRKCVTSVDEDWRTEKGQILSPLRNTPETIERLKSVFKDPRIAAAQLNQKPALDDGNIFKTEYFNYRYDKLPKSVQYTLSCDLTFSGEKSSDYAVIEVWARGLADGKHYKVNQVRRKMGFVETAKTLLHMIPQYGRPNVLVEKTANGFAVLDILEKAKIENVHEFTTGRNSKEQRASTVSYLFDNGDVLYPRDEPTWFEDYVKEMVTFPAARHDDMVDATCNYLAWITGSTPVDLANAFRYAGILSGRL